ncbi:MAG: heme exporter protein CcmB [Pseudomonadota bacterium]
MNREPRPQQPTSLAPVFARLCMRQVLLRARRPVEVFQPFLFFALVILLFPLGLGPAPERLAVFAPAILWITALLANLLGIEGLFRQDLEDGTLDQLLSAPQSLYFLLLPHLLAQWIVSGVVLAVCSPLFAYGLSMSSGGAWVLVGSLLLGSGAMTILGALGAALTVGLRRGGMLVSLLVTPLYVPILIFGTGAVDAALEGRDAQPVLALLGGILAAGIALGPLAISAALRISVEN